jgi:hypothetical protein
MILSRRYYSNNTIYITNTIMFINRKANTEIAKLKEDIASITKDRDSQLTKLKEFETQHKDYIESAQTADVMKQSHTKALETLKSEYETKLAEKDKEMATLKEAQTKQLESIKQETEKSISTVKESVTKETIAIVASQGTNAAIETVIPEKASQDDRTITRNKKVPYKITSFINKK